MENIIVANVFSSIGTLLLACSTFSKEKVKCYGYKLEIVHLML